LPSLSHRLTQQNTHWKTRNPKPFLFTDVREAGLLSRGGCRGGPALLQRGGRGAQPSPPHTTEEGFAREKPLVSKGINHT